MWQIREMRESKKTEKSEKSEVQYFWRQLRRAVSALKNLAHAAWNS